MSAARFAAALAAALAHAVAAAALFAGPELAAAAMPAGVALALALAGGFAGRALGSWTLRDAYRGWALSRNAALMTMALATGVACVAYFPAGLGLGVALLAGYLAARDPPRASDVAFLVIATEVVAAVAFHGKAWQESALFALPTLALAVAFAAREGWDLAHLAAPDEASRRAVAGEYARFVALLGAGAVAAMALGWWLHAGGKPSWAPDEGARGILLALVLAGSAGAAWSLARRRKSPS